MLLKQQFYKESLQSLDKAFTLAQSESDGDVARFKIQELHLINSLCNCFNQVEYFKSSKFDLSSSLKHHNLVEANLTAMRETFELDTNQFKEVIGNLNWKKFSDRIL